MFRFAGSTAAVAAASWRRPSGASSCSSTTPTSSSSSSLTMCTRALTYNPRLRDVQFLYDEVFDMYGHYEKMAKAATPPKEATTKELTTTLLDEAGKLCTQSLFPLYESGDDEGCKLEQGRVTTPKGYKDAYKAFVEGGWMSVNEPEEYGGQDLPPSLGFTIREIVGTANWSFGMYPGLSLGACRTLCSWASKDLKDKYLPKLVSGEWSGTMCLTEPHCGTDLAQVKTKAEKQPDGTYRVTGTKIFISAGDHDLAENIIHVVLARLPGSAPTTKGLSLFLVPRHVVKADDTLEEKRNVECIGLEKKMGIKASATCQLSFDNSVGYLIGEENEGMKEMFTFMNTARMGCAIEGLVHTELAFQNGLRYARERRSMRALSGAAEPDKPADVILCHPNVRHNILFAKAMAEGGRAFLTDLGRMLDLQAAAKDPKEVDRLEHEIGFYTPIAKGCLTEWGVEAASRCLQVWGGHGYIKGNGMEQILRDARIGTIYEGTTGVQAMDFIGRKVFSSKGGNQASKYSSRINSYARGFLFKGGLLGACGRQLWLANKQWKIAILRIGIKAKQDRNVAGAASEEFLMYSGYMTLGYYWLKMAEVASAKVAAGQDPDGFYQAKLDTCEFYFSRVMPRMQGHNEVMLGSARLCESKETTWDL